MPFELQGKTALVTGGTEGIGLALVGRLLDEGCRVLVANRNLQTADAVLPKLREEKGVSEKELAFVKMDVTKNDDVKNAFQKAVEFADGNLQIIVANAGFSTDIFILDVKNANDDEWISGIQGNLVGTILLGRLALTYWLDKDIEGAFVVTSSIEGMHGMFSPEGFRARGHASMVYPVVKAGQISYIENTQLTLESRAKAKKMPRAKQRFNAVLPGAVWTNIWKSEKPEDVVKAGMAPDNWVPMPELVQCFIDCIIDEERRGSSWVVAGTAGKQVRYPDPPAVDEAKFFVRKENS